MKILAFIPLFFVHLAIGQQIRKAQNPSWLIGKWISVESEQPKISMFFYPEGMIALSINRVRYIHNYEFVSDSAVKVKLTSSVDNSVVAYFDLYRKDDNNIELLSDKGKRLFLVKNSQL